VPHAGTEEVGGLLNAAIVGRTPELEEVRGALDALAGGSAGWLAIDGEPGIGKTRLLVELRRLADERGHVVLDGAAAEFERDAPFSPWADALDAYVAAQDLAGHPGWDAELAGELAGILPGLAPTADGSAIAEDRYRAHRAVRRLLEILAAEQPVVLVLDDLHWSDRASLELIAALVRRNPAAPVLFALSCRTGQMPERLRAALADPAVRRVSLAPLSAEQAAAMLPGVAPGAMAELYRHAGGNPFYLEQLARGGGPPSAARPGASATIQLDGVPPAVSASLADELAALDPVPRRLLDAAAIAGEPFEPDLAAAIAQLAPAEGLTALDALLAADLVRPTEQPRRFAFRHPLVRRAVYDAILGGSKVAGHTRAADALAQRGATAAERARHVAMSAVRGDEAAIALLVEAAAATSARAPAAAARWLDIALTLTPADDTERQIAVRLALADAQRALGRLDACRTTLLETVALLPPADAERRADAVARCAAVEHWMGRHAEAHERLTAAADALADRASPAAVALQVELAVDGMYELDFDRTLEIGRDALDAAQALGDRPLIAVAAAALCLGEAACGDMAAAREHHAIAAGEVDALSDAALAPRMEALYFLGWAENYLERYDAAVAHVDRGIAISRATGDGRLVVPMMLVKGFPFEMQGRMPEAVEVCEAAVEASRVADNPHYLFWSLYELGWAHYFSGDLDAAIAAGEESLRVGGQRLAGATMPSAGGGPGWQLATAWFQAGDAERAWAMTASLGSDALEHKIAVERNFDWELMALGALAVGRPEQAEDYARRAEENAGQLGTHLSATLAGRARAALLLAGGRAADAAAACEGALAHAEAIGAGLQVAFTRSLLGHALAAAGERDAAVRTWRTAEHELDAAGSLRERDAVRRELRKLGARVEPRGPASPDEVGLGALSKREREIAELVCDRCTNKEIAARLVLSEKTIESHLRNIFIKLGASSRVEVARVVDADRRAAGP
jgi:DNA-binding CsgD family transcriptional regulator